MAHMAALHVNILVEFFTYIYITCIYTSNSMIAFQVKVGRDSARAYAVLEIIVGIKHCYLHYF